MPYRIASDGKTIEHKKGGKWSVKQHCKSHKNAVKALGLLEGLGKGTIKPSQVGKRKWAKPKTKKRKRGRKQFKPIRIK